MDTVVACDRIEKQPPKQRNKRSSPSQFSGTTTPNVNLTKKRRQEVSTVVATLVDMECPICTEQLFAPIFQCPNGHLICATCKDRLPKPKKCPHCKRGLGNIRSRFAETLTSQLQLPCKFKGDGCREILTAEERLVHQSRCEFRPYECPEHEPDYECKWVGPLSQVVQHLKTQHSGSYAKFAHHTGPQVAGEEYELLLNDVDPEDPEAQEWLMFTEVDRIVFLIKGIWVKDENFSVHVRCVGNERCSARYQVRMDLLDDQQSIWRGPTFSIRENFERNFRKCLSVPVDTVRLHTVGKSSQDEENKQKVFYLSLHVKIWTNSRSATSLVHLAR